MFITLLYYLLYRICNTNAYISNVKDENLLQKNVLKIKAYSNKRLVTANKCP